jgi:glyoxylase I family protein
MSERSASSKPSSRETNAAARTEFHPTEFRPRQAGVRYQVADVERAVNFYTKLLGFERQQSNPAFASVTLDNLWLLLSGPGASGSRPMPDGRRQEPGGWNRIVLYSDALDDRIQELRTAGVHVRNTIETGPGGRQILIEDPDGNPIEIHEEPAASATK